MYWVPMCRNIHSLRGVESVSYQNSQSGRQAQGLDCLRVKARAVLGALYKDPEAASKRGAHDKPVEELHSQITKLTRI